VIAHARAIDLKMSRLNALLAEAPPSMTENHPSGNLLLNLRDSGIQPNHPFLPYLFNVSVHYIVVSYINDF